MKGVFAIAIACLSLVRASAAVPVPTPEQLQFFESKIRPLLVAKCSVCHGEQAQMAGLKLTTAAGFLRGADMGPVVKAGDPGASLLIQAVGYQGKIKMPPTGKLAAEEIAALEAWVKMGAPWPKDGVEAPQQDTSSSRKSSGPQWSEKKLTHWAFQPVSNLVPPQVSDQKWVRTPLDSFILAKLEAAGIPPAPPADKMTLLRRAKFDLHGLPPTTEEIHEFLNDESPEAFARLLDRLLASPQYGEKWGRHWLDVARYGDSAGFDEDIRTPHSWRYRDYVIEAFNTDTPYDRFVLEQLAGDLLPPERPGDVNERNKRIIATGFLAVGPKGLLQQDKVKLQYDIADEHIDTTSKAFMALTISCARCHDHKFDPISTKDYYSLASIFASTKTIEDLDPSLLIAQVHLEPLVPEEVYKAYRNHQGKVQNLRQRIRAISDLATFQHIVTHLGPRLADHMMAAYDVYQKDGDFEKIAARDRLNCETLEVWAKYLKPDGRFRLHLEEWYKAADSNRRLVAEEYQKRYLARGQEWIDKLEKWRQEIEAWNGTDKFPGRPDLEPSEDRFFAEVSLDARSMDEGAEEVDGPFSVPQKARAYLLSDASRQQVVQWREQIESLEKEAPPEPPMAYAVSEGDPIEQHVFLRGGHHNLGEVVPKQFPVILAGEEQRPITSGSGRLELARWLVRPDHPLTSRVIVNRVWLWHFGDGLVRTANNFGLMGEQPTHPELLDYLAREFVKSGWSFKQMHRLIMLSSTYQMSSRLDDAAWEKDPGNRLWSRFQRRRLTVEELRDSLLALDGSLDLAMGGSLAKKLDSGDSKNTYLDPDKTRRRTVYLPIYRNKIPSLLTLFDFVDSMASAGQRSRTNIASQGLYFMNSNFVHQCSIALAEYLLKLDAATDEERIAEAYRMALGRGANPAEVQKMLEYMARYPVDIDGPEARLEQWQGFWRLLLASNEFNYVN